jgi:predicted ATPase
LTIAAILASRWRDRESSIESTIAEKLREIGLIYDFKIEAIQSDRGSYQVWVQRSTNTPKVLITDVGFGVSQILPVLVLCYYVPEGSTIILEHPEIHLHPFAQAGLADVFIDVIKRRKVQIILESHSEHLLRRLQRRIAEEVFSHEQTRLYFCQLDDRGQSHLQSLQLDEFGNIMNWPQDFFGDEMGELAAKTEAEMRRRMEGKV